MLIACLHGKEYSPGCLCRVLQELDLLDIWPFSFAGDFSNWPVFRWSPGALQTQQLRRALNLRWTHQICQELLWIKIHFELWIRGDPLRFVKSQWSLWIKSIWAYWFLTSNCVLQIMLAFAKIRDEIKLAVEGWLEERTPKKKVWILFVAVQLKCICCSVIELYLLQCSWCVFVALQLNCVCCRAVELYFL